MQVKRYTVSKQVIIPFPLQSHTNNHVLKGEQFPQRPACPKLLCTRGLSSIQVETAGLTFIFSFYIELLNKP